MPKTYKITIDSESIKVKLFKGTGPSGRGMIGINFDSKIKQGDIEQIHKAVDVILTLKYGEGIVSSSH